MGDELLRGRPVWPWHPRGLRLVPQRRVGVGRGRLMAAATSAAKAVGNSGCIFDVARFLAVVTRTVHGQSSLTLTASLPLRGE
jgi:hypothetical protein